ncbi:MAG TPA: amidohydrolase, partial [Chitinophagaceae bacterium]|nr:amidohydrolase [Chitinophagaceae bacterium]
HLTVDTVLVASHIVVALQQVISRNKNPFSPSVLTISSIQGGYTTNVIPSEVKLMGTFRAMDETWRFQAHGLIQQICRGIAQGMGAEIDVLVDVGYPVVNNDEKLYHLVRGKAGEFAGNENILETEVRMGSEDFGYYTKEIPGCFYRLGVMNVARGITSGVHTPTFNIDESAIEKGMGMMAWIGACI